MNSEHRYKSADVINRELCRKVYADFSDSLFVNDEESSSRATRKFYATVMADLVSFVEDATQSNEIPFLPQIARSGRAGYDFTPFAERYFKKLPAFITIIEMLSDKYRYSEHMEAFNDAWISLNLQDLGMTWRDIWSSPLTSHPCGRCYGEIFNAIVATLRHTWAKNGYKDRFRRRVYESNRRTQQYKNYVNAWFDKQATINFCRIDLYYRKELWNDITFEKLSTDLDHLCANFRCNTIFRGLRGYIAKIEYGLGKGPHIHMIFLFDTAEKQGRCHVFRTKEIGEYWIKTITQERGEYWNCNAKASQYERLGRLGIGPIHVSDQKRRHNLSEIVIPYLCKTDQFVRPKFGPRNRLMRRGKWPCAEPKKLGAPRKARKIDDSPFYTDIQPLLPPVAIEGIATDLPPFAYPTKLEATLLQNERK